MTGVPEGYDGAEKLLSPSDILPLVVMLWQHIPHVFVVMLM